MSPLHPRTSACVCFCPERPLVWRSHLLLTPDLEDLRLAILLYTLGCQQVSCLTPWKTLRHGHTPLHPKSPACICPLLKDTSGGHPIIPHVPSMSLPLDMSNSRHGHPYFPQNCTPPCVFPTTQPCTGYAHYPQKCYKHVSVPLPQEVIKCNPFCHQLQSVGAHP